ncbi:MAG: hypothetical protein PVJ95_04540 [Cellvibrionales bacterium]
MGAGVVLSGSCLALEHQPWGVYLSEPAAIGLADPAKTAVDPVAVRRQLDATRGRIAELEALWGPYSPELTPALVTAAAEAVEYGVLDAALELYRWALHSTRINEGLASQEQLPLLRAMLEVLRQQGDAVQLAQRSDYFYRLLGRGGQPWDEQRLGASVAWLGVRAELLSDGVWRGREADAVFVIEHGTDLADAVCEDVTWSEAWCAPVTLQVIKLLYLLDYRVDPLVVDQFGVAQERFGAPYEDTLDQSPAERQLRSLERTSRSRGRGLLDRALAVSPDNLDLKVAKADWLWLNDRRQQALALYTTLQQEAGVDFSTPQPLPSIPRIGRDPRLAKEWADLRISGRVSSRGRFEDVEVTGAEADEYSGFVRRQLRAIRCRPSLDVNGEPREVAIDWPIRALR